MQVPNNNKKNNKNGWLPSRSHVAAALATLASCAAFADEPNPWYIGASESITHDSNVNRLSDGIDDPDGRGDTYSSTGLLGGFDQSYGRQHFYGNAKVAYNKYQHHGGLDNTSYGLGAGWDWATVWNLSGGVNLSSNQSLAQLNGNAQAPSLGRNLVKSDQYGANVNWGGPGALTVQGAYTHSRVSYSAPSQIASGSSANTGSLGLYYHVGPTLTTGIAYRITRTDSPAPDGSTITSDGRNIDLSADWRYTVQTGVNARLSFTRQTNAGGGSQTFSGLTGSIVATYAPTAKLGFNLSYARDAGTNGSFFSGTTTTPGTLFYQNSTVANSLNFGATYAATAKIGVTAGYLYRSATITNNGAATTGEYNDKLQTASLGVTWAIARAWSLGCNLSHEKRDVQSSPVYAYTANVVGCSAQVTLR